MGLPSLRLKPRLNLAILDLMSALDKVITAAPLDSTAIGPTMGPTMEPTMEPIRPTTTTLSSLKATCLLTLLTLDTTTNTTAITMDTTEFSSERLRLNLRLNPRLRLKLRLMLNTTETTVNSKDITDTTSTTVMPTLPTPLLTLPTVPTLLTLETNTTTNTGTTEFSSARLRLNLRLMLNTMETTVNSKDVTTTDTTHSTDTLPRKIPKTLMNKVIKPMRTTTMTLNGQPNASIGLTSSTRNKQTTNRRKILAISNISTLTIQILHIFETMSFFTTYMKNEHNAINKRPFIRL